MVSGAWWSQWKCCFTIPVGSFVRNAEALIPHSFTFNARERQHVGFWICATVNGVRKDAWMLERVDIIR